MQDFQYIRPKTLKQALELVDKYGKEAKILAGGTDLIVALRGNAAHCKWLIDVKGVKELSGITYDDEIGLTIGSSVTLNEIIDCDKIKLCYPILAQAAKTLANALIRNRATLIGNICNSSPGGDMLPASLVLEGRVFVSSINGNREIPLKDFLVACKIQH